VGYTLKQFTLLEVTMNEKRFELTVRDSVTGGVLDVDPATYFRALYDTPRGTLSTQDQYRSCRDKNLGQNPLSPSQKMAESLGDFG
jgi:hypothetical protein